MTAQGTGTPVELAMTKVVTTISIQPAAVAADLSQSLIVVASYDQVRHKIIIGSMSGINSTAGIMSLSARSAIKQLKPMIQLLADPGTRPKVGEPKTIFVQMEKDEYKALRENIELLNSM